MSTSQWRPGRDGRAVRHPGAPGEPRLPGRPHRQTRQPGTRQPDPREPEPRLPGPRRPVVVAGGGIAGIAAAVGLAERGIDVVLVEKHAQLGGRVRSWPVEHAGPGGTVDRVTMSRGFHAFFRQYYNLRSLLRRVDPALQNLVAVPDYPLTLAGSHTDSFAKIPRTPPANLAAFVLGSPSFGLRKLATVNIGAALELLDVRFPGTYSDYDGQSAAQFLDRLRFPAAARHLALEVFARSFFAHPEDFSAGELVAMFHTYFVGSSEGLLFDVPSDDYDTVLWAPLRGYLENLGAAVYTEATVEELNLSAAGSVGVTIGQAAGTTSLTAAAVVVATDPATTRRLVAGSAEPGSPGPEMSEWRRRLAATGNAPRFAVWRLWLDRSVHADRPAFLGTSGYGALDNVTVVERFEDGARRWSASRNGSVVELHAYALPQGSTDAQLQAELRSQLALVYPETAAAQIISSEWLVNADCPLIDTTPWADRPQVSTPDARILLAGDGIACDLPVALMERAATTGFLAANALLGRWGLAGHDLWTVPMTGRIPAVGAVRRLAGYSGYSPRLRSR